MKICKKIIVLSVTLFIIWPMLTMSSVDKNRKIASMPPFIQQPGKIKPYWYKTWGGNNDDWAMGVDANNDYIYVTGATIFSDTMNVFLLKYDKDGNLIWETKWAGEGIAAGTNVLAYDDYIYITGLTGTEKPKVFLSKYDDNGDLIWYKTFGGYKRAVAWGMGIYSNNIYLSGTMGGDILILKYDMDGNQIWNKTWGNATEEGYRLAVSSDGICITGTTYSGGPGDGIVIKFDLDGNLIWARTWGDSDVDWGIGIDVFQGYVYIGGYTTNYQALLLKYDTNGNLIWEKIIGSGYYEGVTVKAHNGVVYLSGMSSYGEGGGDIFLTKHQDSGILSWAKTWGGSEAEYVYDMDIENEMIYIAGYTESFGAGAKDAFLLKCNLEGKKSFTLGAIFRIIHGKIVFNDREIMPPL